MNIRKRLDVLLNGGSEACLDGTPLIPLHRDTVQEVADTTTQLVEALEACLIAIVSGERHDNDAAYAKAHLALAAFSRPREEDDD